MGYVGAEKLIKKIGEQQVRDVLQLAKEQQETGKITGNEVKNMGGLISHLIKTKAWEQVAILREAKIKAEAEINASKKAAKKASMVEKLVDEIQFQFDKDNRDFISLYWQQLDEQTKQKVKDKIKLKNMHILFIGKNGKWKEDSPFFLIQCGLVIQELDLDLNVPSYLESKENYLSSQPKYQDIDPAILEDAIAALKVSALEAV